jgi:hypothetical protein
MEFSVWTAPRPALPETRPSAPRDSGMGPPMDVRPPRCFLPPDARWAPAIEEAVTFPRIDRTDQ